MRKLLKVLEEIGYTTPTPVQDLAIPKILEGVDIIASAQTGTGKTAAFMLPILHLLCSLYIEVKDGPQVLILMPTRELAMQVASESNKFSKYLPKQKRSAFMVGFPIPFREGLWPVGMKF